LGPASTEAATAEGAVGAPKGVMVEVKRRVCSPCRGLDIATPDQFIDLAKHPFNDLVCRLVRDRDNQTLCLARLDLEDPTAVGSTLDLRAQQR
jgi:hypothetical protein